MPLAACLDLPQDHAGSTYQVKKHYSPLDTKNKSKAQRSHKFLARNKFQFLV